MKGEPKGTRGRGPADRWAGGWPRGGLGLYQHVEVGRWSDSLYECSAAAEIRVRAECDASPPEEGDWRRLGLALGAREFVAELEIIW